MMGFVLGKKYTGCTLQRNGCKLLLKKPYQLVYRERYLN